MTMETTEFCVNVNRWDEGYIDTIQTGVMGIFRDREVV